MEIVDISSLINHYHPLRTQNPCVLERGVFMSNLTIEEAFDYVLWVKESEGRAEHTLKDYRDHLSSCLEYLLSENLKYIDEVTPLHLRRYFKAEQERGLSPVSLNVKLRYLRAAFNLLENEGYISKSPTIVLKLFKEPEQKVRAVSDEVLTRLLAQPDQRTFLGKRDYVIFLSMLDTGIRPKELLRLRVKDYKESHYIVPATVAKDREERILPLSKHVSKEIKHYLRMKEDWGGELLFPNQEGKFLTPNGLRQALRKYCKKAGIERITPYDFRHTFAVNYLRNGGKELFLQQILGHTSLAMTQRYTKLTKDDFIKEHELVSPTKQFKKSKRRRK